MRNNYHPLPLFLQVPLISYEFPKQKSRDADAPRLSFWGFYGLVTLHKIRERGAFNRTHRRP